MKAFVTRSRFSSIIGSLSSRLTKETVKSFSAVTTHHRYHQETHSFLEPESYIGSWETRSEPREAERRLAQLGRDYAKKVKVYRKEYIHEIEILRVDKQRKDEARLQAERAANEERRLLKAEAAKVTAEERKIAEQEFRKILRNREISGFTVDSFRSYKLGSASSPSLSIWRRKKEMSKEGLIAAKELKRLQTKIVRLDRYICSHVSRLLKSDLVSVLAEFQRQDQVFLCMKLYEVVRKEIWYRPDMFFYKDMFMMFARNRKVDETKKVWEDFKKEGILFDQHTFGDLVRTFLDNELPVEAMRLYEEMRSSPDLPLSLPFRVILKGLISYPELRGKVKNDFLELFPRMVVYDPPEDLSD